MSENGEALLNVTCPTYMAAGASSPQQCPIVRESCFYTATLELYVSQRVSVSRRGGGNNR